MVGDLRPAMLSCDLLCETHGVQKRLSFLPRHRPGFQAFEGLPRTQTNLGTWSLRSPTAVGFITQLVSFRELAVFCLQESQRGGF